MMDIKELVDKAFILGKEQQRLSAMPYSETIATSDGIFTQLSRLKYEAEFLLSTAEQERDQYKAETERLVSLNDRLIENERKLIHENLSLLAKIKESQEEIERMQGELYKSNMYNKDLHTEICGLRAKIKEAQGKPKIDLSFIQDCLIAYKSQLYFDGAEGLRDKIQGQIDLLSVIPD